MAQHGYLREYDESPDRSDDRDRDWSDRDRGFMLDRDRSGSRDNDRGFVERTDDRARYGGFQGDFSRSGREQRGRGDWERSPRNFSSHQDDHYRSWRDRQIEALDRDYADYCREREQQFHSDFDAWRSRRRSGEQPLRTGMTQTAEEVMELDNPAAESTPGSMTTPMGAATLGTNSSGESTSRRSRS